MSILRDKIIELNQFAEESSLENETTILKLVHIMYSKALFNFQSYKILLQYYFGLFLYKQIPANNISSSYIAVIYTNINNIFSIIHDTYNYISNLLLGHSSTNLAIVNAIEIKIDDLHYYIIPLTIT